MLLSISWLKEFVPYTGTAEDLGDRLTMLGLELDGIIRPYENIRDIVPGRVLACEPHPDADHLRVCTVDAGADPLTIVCGAPNVAAGQMVAVAREGVTLPGGMRIRRAKLRGVASCGMICSEQELGLGDEHDGILVLPETRRDGTRVRPGSSLVAELDFDTEILDISVTPNRADCLSVLGLARETAAAFCLPLQKPSFHLQEHAPDDIISIAIKEPELCPAYLGRVLEGARTAPSPLWLRCRLRAVGVRPVSNLVDATNYVLMELGQPLHAFDLDKLAGGRIIVSPAGEGEKLITLDGQERCLRAGDGLIRDAERPVALAGVMGGLVTEITDETRNVFLECAVFRPSSIRRTARRLGLNSEASCRYERGVDQTGMVFALNRAAALMAELSGGTVRSGISRAEPLPWVAPLVRFRPARVRSLLGIASHEADADFCARTLTDLGCEVDRARSDEEWTVRTPGWRYDLGREADLVEEIARYYGMDALPATLPVVRQGLDRFGLPEEGHHFFSRVKHWAAGIGLNEAINYSFVSHRDLDHLKLPREGRVSILNPLSTDQEVLRTVLAPGLLHTVRHNIAQGAAGLRLFEVARSFHADPAEQTTVREECLLGVALYGALHDCAWPHREEDADYVDLKGIVEHFFLNFLHLPLPGFEPDTEHPYLAPAVRLTLGANVQAGVMGRLRPDLAGAYHARKAVWLAECRLDVLQEAAREVRLRFAALPVYPPVRRDITFITPYHAPGEKSGIFRVDSLREAVLALRNPLLESVDLLDLYEPATGTERHVTLRLTFRHSGRTLQDAEVDREREKIASALVQSLHIRV